MNLSPNRRTFQASMIAASLGSSLLPKSSEAGNDEFGLNYLLGSCMYGYLYVGEIFPEVKKTGACLLYTSDAADE